MISNTDTFKYILDYYKETKDAAKERLKLPIIPFYITLVILNYWKPISIYLFSKSSVEGKINNITYLYRNWTFWDHFWNLILLVAASFLISTLFPILMWGIEALLRVPNNRRKVLLNDSKNIDWKHDLASTQHKYDKEKILSGKKEIEEYNSSMEDLKRSYEERIRNSDVLNKQRIQNLTSELENLRTTNSDLAQNYNKVKNDLFDKERQNLRFIYTDDELINKSINYDELFNILYKFIDANSEINFSEQFLKNTSLETRKLLFALIWGRKGNLFRKMLYSINKNDQVIQIDLTRQDDLNDRNFILDNKIGILNKSISELEFYDITKKVNVIKGIESKLNELALNNQIHAYYDSHQLKNNPGNPGDL
ncbi:hypothetical protein SAMN05421789_11150 [Kaistella chaponensis]|uniref:Uncharacterized protein n=1 Tax=Kaistella chaponensis TaxID=713588 RepID=A0A1N7N1A1_9FLAO|nr:hypothetical protein [Kaistella chaponensis]SIS92157.1 hypothetical protein SAMN05421789_11150 [Kaistella chaponensis]